LEVVDQRLHRRVELVARRQHDLAVVGDPGPAREAVQCTLDDVDRLADLMQADEVAVVDVAVVEHDRLHLTLEARAFGPVRPIWRANSGVITPMPRVRSRKIGCWPIRSSYSSTRARISLMNERASRSKATGMSSATPPTWA